MSLDKLSNRNKNLKKTKIFIILIQKLETNSNQGIKMNNFARAPAFYGILKIYALGRSRFQTFKNPSARARVLRGRPHAEHS